MVVNRIESWRPVKFVKNINSIRIPGASSFDLRMIVGSIEGVCWIKVPRQRNATS